MPAAQLPYRYGFGQRVIHILAPHDHDHWVKPLCGQERSLYVPKGTYPPTGTTLKDTCKRCYLLWREATGRPLTPAALKARNGPVTRDVQRQRVYTAESAGSWAPGTDRNAPKGFKTEAQALAYARALLNSPWARARWLNANVLRVRFTHGFGAYSHNTRRMITLGVGQRHEWTLLHEIAHQIVDQSYAGIKVQAHGPLYARVFLALVQHKRGVARARALLDAYRQHKVKVGPAWAAGPSDKRPTGWSKRLHEGRVPA